MLKWIAKMLHSKPGTYSGTIVMLNPLSVKAQISLNSPSKLLYFSCISQTVFSFLNKFFLCKYSLIWHSFSQCPWSLWWTYGFLEFSHILITLKHPRRTGEEIEQKNQCIQVSYRHSALIILIWRAIIRTSYSVHGSM